MPNNHFTIPISQVFNFGTIIARLPEPGAAAGTGPGPAGPAAAGAAGSGAKADAKGSKGVQRTKSFAKGRASVAGSFAAAGGDAALAPEQQAAGQRGGSAVASYAEDVAVKANLKFTNPIKVPCTVNFAVKPRGTYLPGQPFPMEVHPSSIVIPANESRCDPQFPRWG